MKRLALAPIQGTGTDAAPLSPQTYAGASACVTIVQAGSFALVKAVIPDGTAQDDTCIADIPDSVTTTDPTTGLTVTGPAQDVAADPITGDQLNTVSEWASANMPSFPSAAFAAAGITDRQQLVHWIFGTYLGLPVPDTYMGANDVA